MTEAIALLLALSITLVALFAVYLGSVIWVFRRAKAPMHPAWSVIPVVTPFATWRAGSRALSLTLVGLVALYALLQVCVYARG